MHTALPVKQEYKDKNFYGEIIGCKRPKITTYKFGR
jgi:extradiol dioxygenase family protein